MAHKPSASCVSVHRHLWAAAFFEVLPAGTCLFLTQPRKTRRGHVPSEGTSLPRLWQLDPPQVWPLWAWHHRCEQWAPSWPFQLDWAGGWRPGLPPHGSSPAVLPALWSLTWRWLGSALNHPWPVSSGQRPDLLSFCPLFSSPSKNLSNSWSLWDSFPCPLPLWSPWP